MKLYWKKGYFWQEETFEREVSSHGCASYVFVPTHLKQYILFLFYILVVHRVHRV
jgi:hypothetical protein